MLVGADTDIAGAAADAFVFGYPLVLSDRIRAWLSAVPAPDPATMKAPPNTFVHARRLPGPTAALAPDLHADTLRSSAWLDLGHGPIALSVPETHGRFYALSLVDAWTNVFGAVGVRTTGGRAGTFAIAGPRWAAWSPPPGMQRIAAPTRMVRIAGLTAVDAEGCAPARAVQDGYRLAPLGSRTAPPEAPLTDRTPPRRQLEAMPARVFFAELARLMRENPPSPGDRPIVERIRRLGLPAGEDGWEQLGGDLRRAVERGAELGLERVLAAAESAPGEPVGGWHLRLHPGRHGTDYLRRAGAAYAGLEAGPAEDELPALTSTDADGDPLTGRRRYLLRFPPGDPPPVHAFWTLTTYDDRQGLVDNPVDCYSIGDWNGLIVDADGALRIHIRHRRPEGDQRLNWLPAPPGRFNLLLRLVWPQDALLDRRWTPPAVVRAD